jgi:hypothetical protein
MVLRAHGLVAVRPFRMRVVRVLRHIVLAMPSGLSHKSLHINVELWQLLCCLEAAIVEGLV